MSKHRDGLVFAVVGATGAVGREMVSVLEEREVPVSELRLFASERSVGITIPFRGAECEVESVERDSFKGVDIALFSAGASVSREVAPQAVAHGAIVIDNSSCFRLERDVPLVVPEVNADVLRKSLEQAGQNRGMIIANPNCSTIQLVVVLSPLLQAFGLKRIVVSTYQSVSGAGQKGMDELWNQTVALMSQQDYEPQAFPHKISFNCIPHIDVFLENGYTKEEMKIVWESRKILGSPELRITTTAVRVPTFACHAESVNIEFERPCSPEQARELLRSSPGVLVLDDPEEKLYPLGRDVAGTDVTYVGRIRRDESVANGLNLWIVADNLRKGAALNAVQIAEIICNERASIPFENRAVP